MPRPIRLVWALWLTFGLVASLHALARPNRNTVFPVYHASVQRWFAGQDIYGRPEGLDYFRYPPLAVLLLAPFTVLGPAWGGVAWRAVSLGVYGWGVWRLRSDVLPGDWTPRRTAWLLALAGLGAAPGVWNAQSNALLAGLICLGASAVIRRRCWTAAGCLGVALVFKPLTLPLILLLGTAWPRLLPRTGVVVLAGLALPWLSAPPAQVLAAYQAFVEQTWELSGERWPGFRDAWTAWLVLSQGRWGHLPELRQPIDSPLYRVVQVLAALVVFLLVWRCRRSTQQRTTAALGLGGAWLMLLGPASEAPTLAFLAPLLAWANCQRDVLTPGRSLPAWAAVLAFGLSWSGLFRPVCLLLPWLLLALPAASALFLVWLTTWTLEVDPIVQAADRIGLVRRRGQPVIQRGR